MTSAVRSRWYKEYKATFGVSPAGRLYQVSKEYRDKKKAYQKRRWLKLKQDPKYLAKRRLSINSANLAVKVKVITKYGGKCKCCGERMLKLLTMDHINNDGGKHRVMLFGNRTASGIYRWLISNNYPKGFVVMCWNCNCGRAANGGVCPHKEKRPLYC